ncbi:MAG: oxidoreductase molybdopterin binding protein [Acidimicrobiales bacterium]|nr:oxidoreductase molybdopterin binding protein [Acidimicrobiales bacterium]
MDGTPVGRRVFLGMVGLGAAGIVVGSHVQDWMEKALAGVTARDGTGLSTFLPVGRFRIYSVTDELPSKSEADYRLRVGGQVSQPLELTAADLRAMTPTHLTRDFQCVTGWRVHDVGWTGVRLSDLLDRAGVKAGAGGVEFGSFDGAYTESLTMEQARRSDVLVAYAMEGKPVSTAHGGPVRMYVAPMYGYKSCKWLETISVTAGAPKQGYWEDRGYDVDGWVGRSNGRDDTPTS